MGHFTPWSGLFTPVSPSRSEGSWVVCACSEGKERERKLCFLQPQKRADAFDYYAVKVCVN